MSRWSIVLVLGLAACAGRETDAQPDVVEVDAQLVSETTLADTVVQIVDTTRDSELSADDGGREDVEVDPFPGWPWKPVVEHCWRYKPQPHQGVVVAMNSPLAADDTRIYYTTITVELPFETFLEAIDADGNFIGRTKLWDMSRPLPPVIDDEGNILLIGMAIDDWGDWRGVRVQKFGPDFVEKWQYLGDATVPDPVYGVSRMLAMSAAAVDAEGHFYAVVGSYLKSFDADDGHLRWQQNVVPDGLNWSTYNTAPTIVDDLIYMLDESASLVVFDTDGERLIETPVFPGKPLGWMNAAADGRLFAAIYPSELVMLSPDGEILGLWESAGAFDANTFQPMLDGSLIAQASSFNVYSLSTELDTVWRTPDLRSPMNRGAIIDDQGRVGYQDQDYAENFIVLDGRTGDLLFEKHPHIHPRGSYPVMIRPGEVILTGHDPLEDWGHIQCIKVPELGLPARNGWSTPLANFKNQRRIKSLPRPTP